MSPYTVHHRLRVQLAPNWNRWWWIGLARWSVYPPSSCTLAATAWVEESSKYDFASLFLYLVATVEACPITRVLQKQDKSIALICFVFLVYTHCVCTIRKIVPFCWCACIVYNVDDSQWIDIRGLIGRTDGGHKTLQNPISRSGRRWNQQPSSGLLLWPGNIKIKPMDSFFYRWMTQALVLFDVDRLTAQ